MVAVEAVLNGDARALARAISQVENGVPEGTEALRALYKHAGRAVTVGLTGVPGAGKSTLINQMISVYLAQNLKVAVLAIDPTSPFSGGGVLGDRVRMPQFNPNLFIRSVATRGHLGGLNRAAGSIITLLDAAGYDRIIVETVGSGQAEVAVREYVHTVIVVTIPNMGDDIQALKTGILEIGDIYVVNKADLPGADRLESELQEMLSFAKIHNSGWKPSIVSVVAQVGKGVRELVAATEEHYQHLERASLLSARSLKLAESELAGRLQAMLWDQALEMLAGKGLWQKCCAQVAQRKLDPLSAADELAQELNSAHCCDAVRR